MKTAVIYARYSSDSQSEQSIDGQLRVCKEYAKNNDILILNTYIDRAMTGTNDNRPDFQRMIKDSANKQWNYVLVYKLDRFSRNKYESAIHKKTLKDNGVQVVSATEYLPDTPERVIMESMIEGMAQYYSEELSQKIRRGNNESRLKGNLTGGKIPYGYARVNKKAVIIPEEAEIVRYIFEQYALGVYAKDIIAELNRRGIMNRGKPFFKNAIYGILANERYSGIYHYKDQTFDNIYPQIIDKETFEIVRKKVISNKNGKRSENVSYLFKDKLKCGYCGKSIIGENGTARNGDRHYYYKCRGRKDRLNDCKKSIVRKEFLESIIMDFIIEELHKPKRLDEIVKGILQEQERQTQNNTVLTLLIKEKRNIDNAVNNIMTAIEKGVITNTTTKRLKELEEQQEELEKQILIEKSKAITTLTESEIRQFYYKALKLEPEALVGYLIKQIILFDDKIQIIYNTPLLNSPDGSQGFLIYKKTVKYKAVYFKDIIEYEYEIEMLI